jgi:hypothetical protein
VKARRGGGLLIPIAVALVAAGVAAVLIATVLVGSAHADADPASDTLLIANVFYPYSPQVSTSLQDELNDETAAAARVHLPVKVALIGSPDDLGAVPNFYGHPQPYANFLDQEISVEGSPGQPLLVVMPGGYGTRSLPAAATAVVQRLAKPAEASSDGLAQAAIVALPKLAAAAGYRLPKVSVASPGGGPGVLGIVVVAVAAVLIAGAVTALRRRSSRGVV